MKAKIIFLLLVAQFLFFSSARSGYAEIQTNGSRVEMILSDMTLEEKFGQVLLMDFRSWLTEESRIAQQKELDQRNQDMAVSNENSAVLEPTPDDLHELNDEVRQVIRQYRLGNIILFDANCRDTASLVRLTHDLQATAAEEQLPPMLIGTDQEGGSITRLGSGTCMSGNMAIGSSGNMENAFLTGTVLGNELKAVGINCDFAPVADVNLNHNNPVIGIRSFSDDPHTAGAMAAEMAHGLETQSVIPCIKHFPGHGNTETDSHTGFPLVTVDKETWISEEGLSFRYALNSGYVPMVMTAHIQYPGLDDTQVLSKADGQPVYLPATLSHRILTDLLKKELGFNGVVVTDAMNMDAIASHFETNDAVIMALNAGADLICIPVVVRSLDDLPLLDQLYDTLREAVVSDRLPLERLDDAVRRVLTLKESTGVLDLSLETDIEAAVRKAEEIVGGIENRQIERRIADECVQVISKVGFTPFVPDENDSITVLMPYNNEVPSVHHAFLRMEEEGMIPRLNVRVLSYQNQSVLNDELQDAIENADWLIIGAEQIGSEINDPTHWLNVIPELALNAARTDRVVMLCTGLPYQAVKFTDRYPCIVLCNYSGMTDTDVGATRFKGKYGPAIPAGIEKIFRPIAGTFEP